MTISSPAARRNVAAVLLAAASGLFASRAFAQAIGEVRLGVGALPGFGGASAGASAAPGSMPAPLAAAPLSVPSFPSASAAAAPPFAEVSVPAPLPPPIADAAQAARITARDYKPGIVRHMVFFKFKPEVDAARIEEVRERFLRLQQECRRGGLCYTTVEGDLANSPEGADQMKQLGVIVTFRSEGDRNYYVGQPLIAKELGAYYEPAHLAFKDYVGPLLDGKAVPDGVFVFDYTARGSAGPEAEVRRRVAVYDLVEKLDDFLSPDGRKKIILELAGIIRDNPLSEQTADLIVRRCRRDLLRSGAMIDLFADIGVRSNEWIQKRVVAALMDAPKDVAGASAKRISSLVRVAAASTPEVRRDAAAALRARSEMLRRTPSLDDRDDVRAYYDDAANKLTIFYKDPVPGPVGNPLPKNVYAGAAGIFGGIAAFLSIAPFAGVGATIAVSLSAMAAIFFAARRFLNGDYFRGMN